MTNAEYVTVRHLVEHAERNRLDVSAYNDRVLGNLPQPSIDNGYGRMIDGRECVYVIMYADCGWCRYLSVRGKPLIPPSDLEDVMQAFGFHGGLEQVYVEAACGYVQTVEPFGQ